jgi:hypothetical protein
MERAIVVYFPMKRFVVEKMTPKIVYGLLAAALAICFGEFMISGAIRNKKDKPQSVCEPDNQWLSLAFGLMFKDTVLSIFVPFLLIFSMNMLISFKLMKKACLLGRNKGAAIRNHEQVELKSRCLRADKNGKYRRQTDNQKQSNQLSPRPDLGMSQRMQARQKKIYQRATRWLLVSTSAFLIFHLPIAANKLWYFMEYFFQESFKPEYVTSMNTNHYNSTTNFLTNSSTVRYVKKDEASELNAEIIERLACYIYYLNFPFNSLFYVLNISILKKFLSSRR